MGKLGTRGVVYYILVIKLDFLFKNIDQSRGEVEGYLNIPPKHPYGIV